MEAEIRISSSTRRELTVYDTPETRSPEERERERSQRESTHPFLHYLAQFVQGLRPPEASGDLPAPVAGLAAMAPASAAGLWTRTAAHDLVAETPRSVAADAQGPAQVGVPPGATAPAAFAVAPAPPASPDAAARVGPVEIPRLVFGHVTRALRDGAPASTLTVRLDPPHLGKLELAFTYGQQRVTVNVVAATQQAKEHLDMQLAHIRAILHAHRLPTGEMKVMLASEAGQQQGAGTDGSAGQQWPRYRRRRRREAAGEPIAGI